jgi:hypothetical protein
VRRWSKRARRLTYSDLCDLESPTQPQMSRAQAELSRKIAGQPFASGKPGAGDKISAERWIAPAMEQSADADGGTSAVPIPKPAIPQTDPEVNITMASTYTARELLDKLEINLDELRRLTGQPDLSEEARVRVSQKDLKRRQKLTPEELALELGLSVQSVQLSTNGTAQLGATAPSQPEPSADELPESNDDGRLVNEVATFMSKQLGYEVTRAHVLDAVGFFDTHPELRTRTELDVIERRVVEQRREPQEGTLGALLQEYRSRGLIGLSVGTFKALFRRVVPEAVTLDFDSPVSEELRPKLIAFLTPLLLVAHQTAKDVAMRHPTKWSVGDARVINPDVDRKAWVVEYTAACGHSTRMEWETAKYREENENTRVGIFFALCLDCLLKRIKLMEAIPGAASQDSLCSRCNEPMFGRLPAHVVERKLRQLGEAEFKSFALSRRIGGYMKSRRELVDNLQRNVLSIINLPGRLAAEHRDTDVRCIEAQAAMLTNEAELFKACDTALADFELKLMALITQNTEIKARVLAKKPEREREIRISFKLPADPNAYEERRRRIGADK